MIKNIVWRVFYAINGLTTALIVYFTWGDILLYPDDFWRGVFTTVMGVFTIPILLLGAGFLYYGAIKGELND